ncbi:hypothetical protein [Streptosporangium sandarakinum]
MSVELARVGRGRAEAARRCVGAAGYVAREYPRRGAARPAQVEFAGRSR